MIAMMVAWRHGRSAANDANKHMYLGEWERYEELRARFETVYSAPLTDRGRNEAALLRPYLSRIVDAWPGKVQAYQSPQPRAMETAALQELGVEWITDCRLRERCKGDLEEVRITADNRAEVLALAKACVADPRVRPEGGDSVEDRYAELREFLAEREAEPEPSLLLLSTHGELLRILSLAAENAPLEEWARFDFRLPNCLLVGYAKDAPGPFLRRMRFNVVGGDTEMRWEPL